MKHAFAIYCLALSGGASAGVVRPSSATTPVAQASLTLSGQTLSIPRPSNILIHARQDNNNNNNAQIQQLQQQEQQDQQRNSASISSISSSFSSRLTSLSSSASSTISQLQTSLQSAQQAMNTMQQSANDASRSASQASQSAASAVASVQSSAASAQAALSSSLQVSMVASASSAEQVLSFSMSSVMVAAVASVSAAVQQAAAVANLPSPPTATATAAVNGGFPGTVPEVNGAAAPQSQQSSLLQTSQQSNVLGACTTPEVVLAFAGIVLGAVGLASLGCIVFLWFWKRRPAVKSSSDKKASGRGSTGGASGTGLSGESRSSGGSLRQWRIRASTTRPKMGSNTAAASPSDVSPKEYKLPEYERVFPETKGAKAARSATISPTKTASPTTASVAAAPVESTAPTATAVSTNDRIFSAWSFTTAGRGETSMGNNNNNNNGTTFFEASSPTSSARDVVAPLNVYRNQHQQSASRNFSRTSRAFTSSNMGTNQPRPTSSVYEPFGLGIRSEPRGLDRISRMEEEWNRSQMQRAMTTTAGANKANNAVYTTNYAYYAGNGGNNRQKETTASRNTNKDSADSLAREYHDFVSQLAPVSQYGATPGAAAAVASAGTSPATSPSSRNPARREPTVPPAGPLPGLPGGGNGDGEVGTGFSIRPYLQGLI